MQPRLFCDAEIVYAALEHWSVLNRYPLSVTSRHGAARPGRPEPDQATAARGAGEHRRAPPQLLRELLPGHPRAQVAAQFSSSRGSFSENTGRSTCVTTTRHQCFFPITSSRPRMKWSGRITAAHRCLVTSIPAMKIIVDLAVDMPEAGSGELFSLHRPPAGGKEVVLLGRSRISSSSEHQFGPPQ